MFTPQQTIVLDALASGASVTDAAEQAGVHRNTIANWSRENVAFRIGLTNAQYDRALFLREKAEEMTDLAFQTLKVIMSDDKASPSVRLRAALAVVKLVTSQMPPPKRVSLHDVDQTMAAAEEPEEDEDEFENPAQTAQSETPATVQTIRRDHPKTGRNEACPCGSGLKYKRCCLNEPKAKAA